MNYNRVRHFCAFTFQENLETCTTILKLAPLLLCCQSEIIKGTNNFALVAALFLASAVTVGETEGAMDSASVFFLPLLLPITL